MAELRTEEEQVEALKSVAIPVNTLREVSRMVQLEGWSFNTERKYTLKRDSALLCERHGRKPSR